ncbi:MAG: Uma2 family endonuclease [Planctomycetota bacterium]
MLIANPPDLDEVLRLRKERGLDTYDEVWKGTYVMHAIPSDEHQDIVGGLCYALIDVVQRPGLGKVRPGVNLASDENNWKSDYRCPDVVVILNSNQSAVCHDVFWTGGLDLAVEILSPRDEIPSKIDFYAKVGTKELLVIDRDPWRLDLHRHDGQALPVVASSELGGEPIVSQSLPITLRLVAGEPRPNIVVSEADTEREWTV